MEWIFYAFILIVICLWRGSIESNHERELHDKDFQIRELKKKLYPEDYKDDGPDVTFTVQHWRSEDTQ